MHDPMPYRISFGGDADAADKQDEATPELECEGLEIVFEFEAETDQPH